MTKNRGLNRGLNGWLTPPGGIYIGSNQDDNLGSNQDDTLGSKIDDNLTRVQSRRQLRGQYRVSRNE